MTLSRLPTDGLIRYGAFVFNDAVTETLNCSIRPQYDAGRRTVTHSVWDLTLKTYVEGDPSDAAVQAAVAELTKAGQRFTYSGHGCGNLAVNQGGVRDVMWGPLPSLVQLKPVGARRICEVTWNVQVAVPTCADGVTQFSPLEFSFSLSFDRKSNGFTTKTYSAKLRIPNNRLPIGGRGMLDSPDAYLEDITPPLRVGFNRLSQVSEIDESKTTLTLTVVDEETGPNNLPPYIVNGSASHTYASVPGKQGTQWTATLEADFEVRRQSDVALAAEAFGALLKQRIAIAAQMDKIPDAGGKGGKAEPMPLTYTISEPAIFGQGRRAKFNCTYFVGAVRTSEILRSGGLWTPHNAGAKGWESWYATVKDSIGPRGVAGLRFNANEDALVDLCGKAPVKYGSGGSPAPPDGIDRIGLLKAAGSAVLGGIGPGGAFDPPDKDGGWIEFRCFTEVEEDHGTVVAKALPATPIAAAAKAFGWDVLGIVGASVQNALNAVPFPPAADYTQSGVSPSQRGQDVSVQRRTTPTGFLFVRGHALRWGWPIPCPQVTDSNGKVLTNCNRLDRGEGFTQGIVGQAVLPVYYARWNLRYEASAAIQTGVSFPTAPNPSG